MRITNFNCAPLQWTRARSTIHLSGYAAGQQNSRLALTGLLIRADVHTTCHASRVAPWKDDNLTTPKLFCRAGSTHITKSTASTLPTTLPENATVTEVARFLRAHREDIEASRKSAAGRRELARTRNIGLQALVWVQELDGLDELVDDLSVMRIPQAGHFAPWEAPDEVAGALQPFLAADVKASADRA